MEGRQPGDVRVPRSLLIVSACVSISFGALFGLLADLQKALHFAPWGLGVATAAAFIAGFIAQMLLARYADRGHGRAMLVFGVGLSAVGCVGVAAANSLVPLVMSRALLGFGEGMFMPAARRVVILENPLAVGGALGRLAAWQTGGFLVGPPFAAFVADAFGLRVPFIVLAVGLLATMPMMFRFAVPPAGVSSERAPMRLLLRNAGVRAGLYLGAGLTVALGVYDSLWSRFLKDLGASTKFVGVSLTLFGLPIPLLSGRAGRLTERFGARRIGALGLMGAIPFIASYGVSTVPWLIACAAFVHSVFDSAVGPASQAQVAQSAPTEHIASGQGLLDGVGLLVAATASLVAAPVYAQWGKETLWFGLAVCVAACALAGAPRRLRRPGTPRSTPVPAEPTL